MRVYLRLGRVSNLPTVWSNALVGLLLASGAWDPMRAVYLAATMSLFYVGGMFLNDAFDGKIDARERPERPIPSGLITAREVFAIGFGLLGAGEAALWFLGGVPAALAGLALGGAIVLYNAWHKGNALSPLLMGACRVLVYVSAAYGARSEPGRTLLVACAVLLSYLIGLTYVAKQENLTEFRNLWPLLFLFAPFAVGARAFGSGALVPLLYVAFLGWVLYAVSLLRRRKPGNIPRAVVSLIAGISLSDAMLLAACGHTRAAALAVACFFATLFLQRFVSGT